jgi:hypothetical protein
MESSVVLIIFPQVCDGRLEIVYLLKCNCNDWILMRGRHHGSCKHRDLVHKALCSFLEFLSGGGDLFGITGEGQSVANVGIRSTSIEGRKGEGCHGTADDCC